MPTSSGSSPRARGTGDRARGHLVRPGIIPACAGNSSVSLDSEADSRDHPRMRGEQHICLRGYSRSLGSSPHARRTVRAHQHGPRHHGIIPACAGNSPRAGRPHDELEDHPRMRGEQCACSCAEPSGWGSSPHARGTAIFSLPLNPPAGIIPACAGNSYYAYSWQWVLRDHPRVRGEQSAWPSGASVCSGSSPRARGTARHRHVARRLDLIIPACAGNRAQHHRSDRRGGDHPRVRGEQSSLMSFGRIVPGSSPRARGTEPAVDVVVGAAGIIPAHAGNRCRFPRPPQWLRDHPRVRGEQSRRFRPPTTPRGSSPRARGTDHEIHVR